MPSPRPVPIASVGSSAMAWKPMARSSAVRTVPATREQNRFGIELNFCPLHLFLLASLGITHVPQKLAFTQAGFLAGSVFFY